MKKFIKSIIIVLVVMMCGLHIQPDDKELFMGLNLDASLVRPNVIILMDSSISMNTVVFYPKKGLDGIIGTADDGYDPNEDYSGTVYSPVYTLSEPTLMARWRTPDGDATLFQYDEVTGNNWTGCYDSDGSGSYFGVGGNGTANFNEGERIMYIDWEEETDWWGNPTGEYVPKNIAVATIERKDTDANGVTWFQLTDIEGDEIVANSIRGTSETPMDIHGHFQRPMSSDHLLVDLVLYGFRDIRGVGYQDVIYPEEYLTWVYCHATVDQLEAIDNFNKYGIYVSDANLTQEIIDTPNSWSICDKENYQRPKQLWTRIQVSREVMCWLAREHSQTVMLGLFKFKKLDGNDAEGGDKVEGLGDMSDINSLIDFLGKIWAIKAESWTPLAEALADIWYYYKPGPESKTYWPVDYELEHDVISVNNSVSDIEYWCQNNYVVIMTDGESTRDDFGGTKYANSIFTDSDYPVTRQDGWENWTHGWGDPDNNDAIPDNYNPDTATYCPNNTCWLTWFEGTDYLDDVAYFLRHQDMFPDRPDAENLDGTYFSDDPVTGWPSDQKIFTYTIGFNIDNHLLQQTAINGDGGYYTADSFDELKQAFQAVITSINLRNFAFSSITAPNKTTTATNEDMTVSYVGYFMPSQAASIWDGHLLSFELVDKWGFDTDTPEDQIDPEEYVYDTQEQCINASNGRECVRTVFLDLGHEWDAADKIPPINRSLYTHDYGSATPTDLIEFTLANQALLQPLFGASVSDVNAQQIINKIRLPQLADIFHSDVGFVGPPSFGKQFISNINPTGTDDQTYAEFYEIHKTVEEEQIYGRDRVLFTGTNDGIMHMFYADAPQLSGRAEDTAGQEVWGFIPDEVLPSYPQIVVDGLHTYTVDGRIAAEDIYYVKSGDNHNTWSTIMVFGLRRGGRSFYAMDITTVGSQPNLLWKFNDPDHSGQSWGIPGIGRIKIQDPNDQSQIIDKWVAILPGGFEFNSGNPTDIRGKAIFVVDAATGELIWKIGYQTPVGDAESPDAITGKLTDNSTDANTFLTSANVFNYPIPSAVLSIDVANNGYVDTIYFGNLGGHLFKANIGNLDPGNWTVQIIFEDKYIPQEGPEFIESIAGNEFTLTANTNFVEKDFIMGQTSYATGYITYKKNRVIEVNTISGTFQESEEIKSYQYDPIYLSPAAAYDNCYQLWLVFGTGDRDRPRTNPYGGRFIAFRDNNAWNYIEDSNGDIDSSTLIQFEYANDALSPESTLPDPIPADINGFYFNFPDSGEKIFEPKPFILPGEGVIPEIYFNTYQPPAESISNQDNPCDMPQEGTMQIYKISLKTCGAYEDLQATQETGRIAGGGIYGAKEYVIYKTTSGNVGDVPGGEGWEGGAVTELKTLPYAGGLVFWKEKKR